MDINARRNHYGRLAVILASAMTLFACSSQPRQDTVADEEAFQQKSGTIASSEAPVAATTEAPKPVQLTANYPSEYVVKKGDTLWDIASMFLKDPWYWPEIWQRNPQVQNPHLIFPGDILTLIYVDGMPRISVARPEDGVLRRETTDMSGRKVVKLTPSIHRQSLSEAIPSIPADAIRQFLTRPRVVNSDVWDDAPYIVGSDDDHLVLGSDNKVYVRGELDKERVRYSVFRRGNRLIDPESGDLLGYEIVYAGQAKITNFGDPSTAILTKTTREVLLGDRLLPTDKGAIDQQYYPKLPEKPVYGQVISLFDAISSIAKHQIAVINRGSNHNLEVGHLLATYQFGGLTRDRFLDKTSVKRGDDKKLEIMLPDERSGIMMLFKVFDDVSYGLILKSTRTISKLDKVERPR